MRVAMVTPFPEKTDRIIGGVAGVATYLSKALSEIPGVEVEIIASNLTQKQGVHDFNGLRAHFMGPTKSRVPGMRTFFELPTRVERTLGDLEFDIVHVQGYATVASRLPWPTVLTIHGIPEHNLLWNGRPGLRWPVSRLRGVLERRPRGRIDNAIIISPYVRDAIGHQLKCRMWDIPNPIADSFFDIEARPETGRILFAGVITPLKNIEGMLRALALLLREYPRVQLRLAGAGHDSPYGRRCRALADELGIANNIEILGSLGLADLQREMGAANCLLLSSFQESAPLVIGEAMAAALPVVASDVGGISDLVSDATTGWLVDPRSPDDIAGKLQRVLDPEVAAHMGLAARQEAERRFRASTVAKQTLEVYQAILSEPGFTYSKHSNGGPA